MNRGDVTPPAGKFKGLQLDQAEGEPLLSGDGRDARRSVAEHAIEVASGLAVLVLRLVIALGGIARAPAHIGARLCHRHHFHNAVNGPETGDVSRVMLAGRS